MADAGDLLPAGARIGGLGAVSHECQGAGDEEASDHGAVPQGVERAMRARPQGLLTVGDAVDGAGRIVRHEE
jgi:hypothetical protein